MEFTDAEARARAGLLLARLPERPALDLTRLSVTQARQRGEALRQPACGAGRGRRATGGRRGTSDPPVVRNDHTALPAAPGPALAERADRRDRRLQRRSLDRTNIAAGLAVLERARTWSILTLDPAAIPLHAEPHFGAMLEGWSHTADFEHLPAAARVWACQVMLGVTSTLATPPTRLAHVRRRLADLQNARD